MRFGLDIDFEKEMILFDAQNFGGLLIAIDHKRLNAIIRRCADEGIAAVAVAEVVAKKDVDIVVK